MLGNCRIVVFADNERIRNINVQKDIFIGVFEPQASNLLSVNKMLMLTSYFCTKRYIVTWSNSKVNKDPVFFYFIRLRIIPCRYQISAITCLYCSHTTSS